jgi:hypothetical protein
MNIKEYLDLNPMGSSYLKYSYNVYSQNGEDGIINQILKELEIKKGTIVEFGAWDGIYLSNTYNLTKNDSFNFILIEGDFDKFKEYKKDLKNSNIYNLYVSPNKESENSIDNILKNVGLEYDPNDFVLMSIDVDSCDYYIMESIEKYRPIILIVETNISFPLGSDFKSLDKGCSFDSVWDLGKSMGYSTVAYTSNSILVRNDYVDKLKSFNDKSNKKDIYIDSSQYLTLARLDKIGNILEEYYGQSEHYPQSGNKN